MAMDFLGINKFFGFLFGFLIFLICFRFELS